MSTGASGGPVPAYVTFTATVTPQSTDAFLSLCTGFVAKGVNEVQLLVSSPGGNVMLGVTIYNVMRSLPIRFVTHNIGSVDSIALLPYLAGEERYSAKNATFMFHGVAFDVQSAMRMDEKFCRERLDAINADHKRLSGIIAERATFRDESEILGLYSVQATRDAGWAKQVGIAHDIREVRIPANTQIHRIG